MNKEQLIKEYDKKAKALRDEFISKLEFELTYPKTDETVYYIIGNSMNIASTFFWDTKLKDRYTFEHGLYFNTKQEAEQYLKERKLLFKLHQWAKLKNDGWEPDWSSWRENKYYIFYNYDCCEFDTSSTVISDSFKKLPYFKTKEIAQECIDLFGDEIKEVFC